MKTSIKKGFSFGVISGIITTLGLMIGLYSGTNSKLVVISGIIVIAIADALSDALGIHISEEAESKHKQKQIWESTFATLFSKFIFAITFMVPVLLFNLFNAIIVSIIWGIFLISLLSYFIAKRNKMKPYKVIFEHITIAILVVIVTYFVGKLAELIV